MKSFARLSRNVRHCLSGAQWCIALLVVALAGSSLSAIEMLTIGNADRPWRDYGVTPGAVIDFIELLNEVQTSDGEPVFIDVPDTLSGWIMPLRLRPDFNISRGVMARGGNIDVPNLDRGQKNIAELEGMLDGNSQIAFDRKFTAGRILRNYGIRIVIDLGARFGVDRILFYPRMTQQFPFENEYIRAYELYLNDGLPQNLFASGQPIFVSPVVRDENNSEPVVEISIEPQYVQFVELRSITQGGFEIDQIEIYGTGFVPTARYLSNVLDLNEEMVWGRIRWQEWLAGAARNSRGEVRVRSGLEADPEATTWSSWQLVTNGQQLTLPAPRRYFQFRIDFANQELNAARAIAELEFEFARPPVDRIVAEVAPGYVEIGEPTTFTYVARLFNATGRPGFQRFEIETPARVEAVREVEVIDPRGNLVARAAFDEDLEVAPLPIRQGAFSIEAVEDDHFALGLPLLVEDGTLLKVVFDAAVFRYGTPFHGRAFADRDAQLPLRTEGGDATAELDTDGLQVRVSIDSRIIGSLQAEPVVFTPNGDGVNDVVQISYGVLHLLEPAPAQVRIFELSGRLVRILSSTPVLNGRYVETWDGRDDQGQLLPPGLYLIQVEVAAARATRRRSMVVALVY